MPEWTTIVRGAVPRSTVAEICRVYSHKRYAERITVISTLDLEAAIMLALRVGTLITVENMDARVEQC